MQGKKNGKIAPITITTTIMITTIAVIATIITAITVIITTITRIAVIATIITRVITIIIIMVATKNLEKWKHRNFWLFCKYSFHSFFKNIFSINTKNIFYQEKITKV
jgi:hypothetical protein